MRFKNLGRTRRYSRSRPAGPLRLSFSLPCDTKSHRLSVLKDDLVEPGMFLPDPTQACYRRADDGVRSPADNVPKRVQMVTGEPFGESSPVKAQGRMIG